MGKKSVSFEPKYDLRAVVVARLAKKAKNEPMKGVLGSLQFGGVPREAVVTNAMPLNVMELIMMTISNESVDSTRPLQRKRRHLDVFYFSRISHFI